MRVRNKIRPEELKKVYVEYLLKVFVCTYPTQKDTWSFPETDSRIVKRLYNLIIYDTSFVKLQCLYF